MGQSHALTRPRSVLAPGRTVSFLAIAVTLAVANLTHAEEDSSACVVSFAGVDGSVVYAREVLGTEPVPRFVQPGTPTTGRWSLGGGDLAALDWSRSESELRLAVPAGAGPVAFWVRDRVGAPHERTFVFSWDTRAGSSSLPAVASPAVIRGRVQSSDGRGVDGVTVSAVPLASGGCESWASTVTDSDGRFVLSGLLAGRYQVVLGAEYPFTSAGRSLSCQFPRLADCAGSSGFLVRRVPDLPVELTSRDAKLEPFVVEPCASELRVDARSLAADGDIEVARADETPHWLPRVVRDDVVWLESRVLKLARKPKDGWVDFGALPPGPYRLNVWRARGVVDTYDLELGPGKQTITPPPAANGETGRVEGRVEDWALLPLAECTLNRSSEVKSEWGVLFYVVLAPAVEGGSAEAWARVQVDAEGRFAIEGIPEGEYTLQGVPRLLLLGNAAGSSAIEDSRERMDGELAKLGFPKARLVVKKGERVQAGIRFQ